VNADATADGVTPDMPCALRRSLTTPRDRPGHGPLRDAARPSPSRSDWQRLALAGQLVGSGMQDHRERLRGADAGGEVEFDAGLDVVLGDALVPQPQGGAKFDASKV
jgi:hypothetical protein